jgi:adenosylhomocysteine nucleosidase
LTTRRVGIVCALRSEARHLGRIASPPATVQPLADGNLWVLSGAGQGAAAAGARALLSAGADALLSFGLAGGLDPGLSAGRIVVPAEILAPDGTVSGCDASWREQLAAALAGHAPVGGRLASVVAPLASAAAKRALFAASGACAVDMESAAIARVAHSSGVPCAVVRVVVDRVGDPVPAAVLAAMDAAGEVSPWRLCGLLLREPGQLGALLRLARNFILAGRSLRTVARSGALGPQLPTVPIAGAL